jgi:hypothetical protein
LILEKKKNQKRNLIPSLPLPPPLLTVSFYSMLQRIKGVTYGLGKYVVEFFLLFTRRFLKKIEKVKAISLF